MMAKSENIVVTPTLQQIPPTSLPQRPQAPVIGQGETIYGGYPPTIRRPFH